MVNTRFFVSLLSPTELESVNNRMGLASRKVAKVVPNLASAPRAIERSGTGPLLFLLSIRYRLRGGFGRERQSSPKVYFLRRRELIAAKIALKNNQPNILGQEVFGFFGERPIIGGNELIRMEINL
ncbi:hypothetical protein O181_031340 [Austropuccinia psidii MF-1]|uniref:Uncharacterized protein n=1 Tax=Austropuccinia psidii MF-1 TaxID=1389203 RepID=A0A9Q3CXS9_9BASI|nr:hypothetical protein [Austropuccinia psidii MF-1]